MITTVQLINMASHIVAIMLYVMSVPEIHSLSIFPVFNAVLLTIVIISVHEVSRLTRPM